MNKFVSITAVIPLSMCCIQPVSAQPDLPKQALLFVGHSDVARKDYDIWRVCADGSQYASVVVQPENQSQFSLSHDGKWVLYSEKDQQHSQIVMRSLTGKPEVRKLTNSNGRNTGGVLSPDQQTLLFFSTRDGGKPEMYQMELKTKQLKRLTDNQHYESGASWHPSGKKVIFTRYIAKQGETSYSGHGEVIELHLTSGKERQLTKLKGYNGGARYSPDGKQIAFHRVYNDTSELWLMNADGTNAKALTNSAIDEYSPAWSDDGHWLAYTAGSGSDGQGTFDLYMMRSNGTGKRRVLAAANTQMEPMWLPGDSSCN